MGSDSTLGSDRRQRSLTLEEKARLVDAIDALDVLSDPQKRRILLNELREEFGTAFEPGHLANADTWSLVSACLTLNGARSLLNALRLLGGHSREWLALAQVIDELFPLSPITSPERRRLEIALESVPGRALERALAESDLARYLDIGETDAVTGADVLLRIEERAVSGAGEAPVRAILSFLERVAHHAGGRAYLDAHEIIGTIADRLVQRPYVEELCRRLLADEDEPGGAARGQHVPPSLPGLPTGEPASGYPAGYRGVKTPLAVWGGVPPRNRHFAGRTDALNGLQRVLARHQMVALIPHSSQRLGGVGKSQVAIEYAYRSQRNYDLIWWIPADDVRSIRRSLVSLARRLHLPESPDVHFTIKAVLDELRSGQNHPQWLLVFDNASRPSDLDAYLPSGSGHVVITSRNRDWRDHAATIEVDVFQLPESIEMLRERWPLLADADARALAERVGHLPLALELAAAVHRASGVPIAEYLQRFDDLPELLGTKSTEYPQSVAKTYRLAFDDLNDRSVGAAQLLQLCAFLSSSPISVPMLTRGRGAPLPSPLEQVLRDEIHLRRAVREIGHYELAQLDPGRDFITVHMLVRAVLRDALSSIERDANERAARALLAYANPFDPDRQETWPHYKQIAPHVTASGVVMSDDPHVRRTVLDQIRYYYLIGDIAESAALAHRAAEHWKAMLGEQDPMTLLANFHRANALRSATQYREARDLNLATLSSLRATLSSEHEYTLMVANSVGADLRLLGEFEQARLLDEQNHDFSRGLLGEDDPDTLRAANNLAVDYQLLGDFRRAFEIDNETLRRREDVLGEDSAEVLSSLNNKVRDILGIGDYDEALRLQLERLPVFESKLPKHHTFLLTARRNLAILWRKTGNYGRALEQAESNLVVARSRSELLRESLLAAMMTMFNTLRVHGDLVRAHSLGEEALTGYRVQFGPDHPFTLACMVNLAIVYRARGQLAVAAELNDEAYRGLVERLGEDHAYTMSSAANQANDLAASGRAQDALRVSRAVVERSRLVRPPDHPYTLACAGNLVLDLVAMREHEEADRLRNEVRERLRLRLGPEHPETINMERGKRAELDIEIPPP